MRPWALALIVTVLAAAAPALAETRWRWIEAENAFATNMTTRHPFAPQNDAERDRLSGGAWIGGPDQRQSPLFAVYDVEVPADGTYHLYVRKFWKHGPYRVSFDGGAPVEMGNDVALLDNVELRTHVVANWTSAGTFVLTRGTHRMRIEAAQNNGAIAFDCFLLTPDAFTPRGKLKPDERLVSNAPGHFAWDMPADAVDSPIDLRPLNEAIAGSEGFIIAEGDRFLLPRSRTPVRFWGVNVGSDLIRMPPRELDQLAAMLARRGVNLIRLHGAFYAEEGERVGDVDFAQLDRIRSAVAIFKRHGIYSTLSIYFPVWVKLDARHGWEGYDDKNPFGLLFVDERFMAIYRNWWRELLTRTDAANPVALKDEPAVLSLEVQNEDSLFFWTFTPYKNIPASTTAQFEKHFAAWLAQKYGSAQRAIDLWRAEALPGDDPRAGRVGLGEPWRWANRRDARSKDTVAFLYELQHDFYAATRAFLRDELGSRSLVSASNWTTASDQYLTPLERASNLAGDFIDRHGYFGGIHEGPRAGWSISPGDRYADRSALRFDPEKPGDKPAVWNPIHDTTYNDKPTMISEIDWLEPNASRAEAPLLCAAYAAQQDVDALAFFAAGGPTWQSTTSKFALMTPVSLGQFPAAALIYRRGLVEAGPPAFGVSLALRDLLNLQGGPTGVDPRVKLLGKSLIHIGDESSIDANPSPSAKEEPIVSATGHLSLDPKVGLLTIAAPAARGAVGFLAAAGPVVVGDVTITSDMPFAAIALVALDGKPVAQSGKLLVQVMSGQQNSGFVAEGEGVKTIRDVGGPPILVRDFAGAITLPAGTRWQALPIDGNLAPRGEAKPIGNTLTLDAQTPYYLLTPTTP